MPRHIAFLRGINLGKRRVKMERLAGLFEELRFTKVWTYIASGNVVFDARAGDRAALERRIEAHLAKSLGYEVFTFVRTAEELAAIAEFEPFPAVAESDNIYVSLCRGPLGQKLAKEFAACGTEVDEFRVRKSELYWLCRVKLTESTVWRSPALKALSASPSTMRNLTTLRKLAAKLS
jgi:uncharacterized protein (DUF1697 family)